MPLGQTMFCQTRRMIHAGVMKWLCAIAVLSIVALGLIGCSNSTTSGGPSGTQYPGVGPFDAQGNYVEEWADNPTKWKRPGAAPRKPASEPTPEPTPQLAVNDQPPMNSVPLATSQPESTPSPRAVAPAVSSVASSAEVKPKVRPKVSETVVREAKPKPKPKLVKAKPKPKPKVTRYVVKKGDSLSAIASRQGSSVAAIQKANGISGSIIRPGQSLVIPKR